VVCQEQAHSGTRPDRFRANVHFVESENLLAPKRGTGVAELTLKESTCKLEGNKALASLVDVGVDCGRAQETEDKAMGALK
jgi:hypothetical protein